MSLIKIRAAMQIALDAMPGLVPAVGISTSSAGSECKVVTTAPHNLISGTSVTISGHSTFNGMFNVNVIDDTMLALVHRVTGAPIASAAGGVGGVLRANLTAWEGVAFKPLPGLPYQRVHLLPATPEDIGFGDEARRETGILQITLCYPVGEGTYDATLRAEMIRDLFRRGSTFEHDGVVVKILKTPAIISGLPQDESYWLPVLIEYQADIFK